MSAARHTVVDLLWSLYLLIGGMCQLQNVCQQQRSVIRGWLYYVWQSSSNSSLSGVLTAQLVGRSKCWVQLLAVYSFPSISRAILIEPLIVELLIL